MTKQTCRDCNAKLGALHTPGCDFELCGVCRQQSITCDCNPEEVEKVARIPYGGEFRFDEEEESNIISPRLKPWLVSLLLVIVLVWLIAPLIWK